MQAIPHFSFVRFVTATLALASVCVPAGSAGQEEETLPEVTEGSRVRVTSPLLERKLVGTLVTVGDEYVMVEPGSKRNWGDVPLRMQREQITKLEVSRGKKRHTGTGALVGAGIGALGAIAALTCEESYGCGPELAPVSLVFYTGLGAGIGALIKSDRWEEARLPEVEPMVPVRPGPDHPPVVVVGLRLRI